MEGAGSGTAEITVEPSGGVVSLIKRNICDRRITPVSHSSTHKLDHATLRLYWIVRDKYACQMDLMCSVVTTCGLELHLL